MIASGFRRRWSFCFYLLGFYFLGTGGAAWAQSAGAALPLKTDTDAGLWRAGLQSMAIGIVLLSAAALLLWWLRNRQQPPIVADKRKLAPLLLLSRRLTRNTVLLVVQWEDKTYLLAESGHRVQLIDSRAPSDSATAAHSEAGALPS